MKATELRIGNWVNGPHGVAEITSLNRASGWAEYLEYMEDVSPVFDFDARDIKPIPLTEEWLKKFGFEKVNHIYGYSFFNLEKLKLRLYENRTEVKGVTVCHCEYVHQLQNLYFALTGVELETKPEK